MNKYILLLVFITVSCRVNSQCLVTSLIINTGYDPVTGFAIAGGANGAPAVTDPHWVLTAVSPGVAAAISATPVSGLIEVTPGHSADITTLFHLWTNNPFGNPGGWISCLNSFTYNTDGTGPVGTACNMTLSRPFRMCYADSIKFNFYIANDNYINQTDIDGLVLSFSQPAGNSLSNYEAYTYFTQTVYLTAGTHAVNFETTNYNELYPTPNPAGLNVYGTVSSATGSNSLVSESAACSSYVCGGIAPAACDSISLPDTLHYCSEAPITIPATVYGSDSITSIAWTPVTGLSDPTILDPTVSAAGWYFITVNCIMPGNLVVNGDFSAGNTGFTSGYTYLSTAPPPGTASIPGDYDLTTNPYIYNIGWPSMADHTTGTGNMMTMDAATTPGISFWCQTIPVTPGTNYVFSVWSALLNPPLPSIQITINGVSADTFTTSATLAQWVQNHVTWNSGTATSATICMTDVNTTFYGNDFAIDDISLQQLCTATDSVYVAITHAGITTSSRDTSICSLVSSIVLTAPTGYSAYLWNTGATTSSVTAGAGIYWVDASVSCATVIDTFLVAPITAPVTTVVKNTTVCDGDLVTLDAPAGYSAYLWSTGAASASISAGSGVYWVNASVICAMGIDTFYVTAIPLPAVSLGNDTAVCEGISVTLSSLQPDGSQYLWSNGSTGPSITVSAAGTYSLTVTGNGCSASSSVRISELSKPQAIDLGPDTILCNGDQLLLSAGNEGGSLLWNTGDTKPGITVTESGDYWLTATNICGSTSDTVKADFELCDIWFPSAFTPNDDGRNDIAHVVGNLQRYQDFSLSIYNRWGQRIFYTEDIYSGWNGKFNGVNQDLGTYFYMIFYSLEGKKHMMKGDLELIR